MVRLYGGFCLEPIRKVSAFPRLCSNVWQASAEEIGSLLRNRWPGRSGERAKVWHFRRQQNRFPRRKTHAKAGNIFVKNIGIYGEESDCSFHDDVRELGKRAGQRRKNYGHHAPQENNRDKHSD